MAKKQKMKGNKLVWVEDKLSSITIIENDDPDNGFEIINEAETTEPITNTTPKRTGQQTPFSLSYYRCPKVGCKDYVDESGYCQTCRSYTSNVAWESYD